MPRSQFNTHRRDRPLFVDRYEQLRLIGDHVDLLRADFRHFVVFEVIGLGGAGKTQLLRKMKLHAQEGERVQRVLSVTLNTEASATEIAPLRQLREQVPFHCLLFDTALLTLLSTTGQSVPPNARRLTDSPVFQLLDAGASATPVLVPPSFAMNAFHELRKKLSKVWNYDEREFVEIAECYDDHEALRAGLPHWLGVDLLRRIERNGDTLVVFYDGYDKQAVATRESGAPWLRELIGTLEHGVHVIAARDPLGWDQQDWGAFVTPIFVDRLPDDEARKLISSRLGTVAPEVEERMLKASKRLPYYLEAAISNYRLSSEAGPADAEAMPSTPEDTMSRLIGHLERADRNAAIALATVQTFDRRLFSSLIRDLHIPVTDSDFFTYVTQWFSIERLDETLYKTHDLLTAFVRNATNQEAVRHDALVAATRALSLRCGDSEGLDATLALFSGVMEGWQSLDEVPAESVEALVDIGYHIHDAGYWHELSAMAAERAPADAHPTRAVTDFFVAIAARRTAGVDRAIQLMARMETHADTLGRHARSVEIEAAYLGELAGNYALAREQFAALDVEAATFDPNDRSHARVRLYRADMMINDGTLLKASRLLLEARELMEPATSLTAAELGRHRAHAFRFSFMLDDAERQYREQLAISSSAQGLGLVAKLQTNIAETLCWGAHERALEEAAMAIALNTNLGNRIELAKCDAASAIALARLGELRAARDAAARSVSVASAVGYPAGVAFALQAEAIVEHFAGNADGFASARAKLTGEVEALDTYGHLRLVPAFLADDAEALATLVAAYDWIEPDGLVTRLRGVLGDTAARAV